MDEAGDERHDIVLVCDRVKVDPACLEGFLHQCALMEKMRMALLCEISFVDFINHGLSSFLFDRSWHVCQEWLAPF